IITQRIPPSKWCVVITHAGGVIIVCVETALRNVRIYCRLRLAFRQRTHRDIFVLKDLLAQITGRAQIEQFVTNNSRSDPRRSEDEHVAERLPESLRM